jgi:hypothetical protein
VSNSMIISVKDKLECWRNKRTWPTLWKWPTRHLPEGTEEDHKTPELG